MKKTAIALAIAGLAAVSVAQAAPQANTFYVGAKAGWASFHNKVKGFHDELGMDLKRNSVTYGVFGGYQITDNFAVELGYDYYGGLKANNGSIEDDDGHEADYSFKHSHHGAQLGLKASYPVLQGLDVYARVAAALIRSDYSVTLHNETVGSVKLKDHSLKVSPAFAAGIEYAIIPELAVRVEYQWVNKVGRSELIGEQYRPNIGSVTAGLSYRFGQGAAPMVEEVNKTFALNSDVLFAFNKSNLKDQAASTLDGLYGEIAQLSMPAVKVAGYTDRLGSDAYNLKLSQKRAETVANYLVSKGVAQDAISAEGYGEANPVTGANCDKVKGRKALIACLAPDRRVEVSVKGNKQVTM